MSEASGVSICYEKRMKKTLPLFPLNLIAYPGEDLNLHIFEPRYRQLVDECLEEEKTFGIPAFIGNKMPGCGTEMHITSLAKRYDDGRMDIKTKGVGVFRLLDFVNPCPGKLYAGGDVEMIPMGNTIGEHVQELLGYLRRLYQLLQTAVDFDPDQPDFSFRIAHKIGCSLEQEYELLTIADESDRQLFLIEHLKRVTPVIADMEETKQRIRMNGHFKNFDPLDF